MRGIDAVNRMPFYAALAMGAGPYFFYRGFRDYQLKRLIEDTPTAHIRSMAMGFVEVKGEASARSEMLAPFSGSACAYWQVDISTQSGRDGTSWTVVHRAHSKQPFYIDDGTGVALVYPDAADCKVPFAREELCAGITLPEPYKTYVKEHGGIGLQVARLGNLRFRERMIEPGTQVFVLGSAFPRATSVSLSDGDEMAATGTDDGFAARLRAMDDRLAGVIRKGQNDPTFVISLESALALEVGLGVRSIAKLIGGPLLTLFGLWYWLEVIRSGHLL